MNAAEYNDTTFEKMVDEFLDERWKYNPTEATLEGIHDYDRDYPGIFAEGRRITWQAG